MNSANTANNKILTKFEFFALPQDDTSDKLKIIDSRVESTRYGDILNNQRSLEAEFETLFAVLQQNKDKNERLFWEYCYYCASLLEVFYVGYKEKKDADNKYTQLKAQINEYLSPDKAVAKNSQKEEHFIQFVYNTIKSGISDLATIPRHISKIQNYVVYSNLFRLYWVFCRLTLTTGLALARDTHILDYLDATFGMHTDVDKIVSVLQAPNGVLNYFSVGLFLARFIIDAGLLVKHTFFPNEIEKNATRMERFKYELEKRHCNFINDLVWASVNFLTNFNKITHIPAPVAGAVTAAFLGFDVCMNLYKTYRARNAYLLEKERIEAELEMAKDNSVLSNILKKQLHELDINWKGTEAGCYFAVAAATVFMLGFSGALLFSPPGMIMASFFMCIVAATMYFSSGSFEALQKKNARLSQGDLSPQQHLAARHEYESARNEFILSMVKNTTIPVFLLATFTICWPAAVVLAACITGHELYNMHKQHTENSAFEEDEPPKGLTFGCC